MNHSELMIGPRVRVQWEVLTCNIAKLASFSYCSGLASICVRLFRADGGMLDSTRCFL